MRDGKGAGVRLRWGAVRVDVGQRAASMGGGPRAARAESDGSAGAVSGGCGGAFGIEMGGRVWR